VLTTENKFIVVGRCRAAVGNGVLKWLFCEIRGICAWDRKTSYYQRTKLLCVAQIYFQNVSSSLRYDILLYDWRFSV